MQCDQSNGGKQQFATHARDLLQPAAVVPTLSHYYITVLHESAATG